MARRGRNGDPAKRQRWGDLVDRWQRSGRSVRAFCRDAGVKEAAFYWWRRVLDRDRASVGARRERGGQASTASGAARRPRAEVTGGGKGRITARFLPVCVVSDQASELPSGVEIHLGNGRSVRVCRRFDGHALAEVLAVLEARPC
jgi:hypothetical protein